MKVENPFIAAAALRFRFPILVVSSNEFIDKPIIFTTVVREENVYPPIYLANLDDVHFEPYLLHAMI